MIISVDFQHNYSVMVWLDGLIYDTYGEYKQRNILGSNQYLQSSML